jgi:isocitrate/methylisocitrate lyase
MFELAQSYRDTGMSAYAALQATEFEREADSNYRAVKHQAFVGTGYFDTITQIIAGGTSSTTALTGSTEQAQFSTQISQMTEMTPISA